jgi:hypothetical protein
MQHSSTLQNKSTEKSMMRFVERASVKLEQLEREVADFK